MMAYLTPSSWASGSFTLNSTTWSTIFAPRTIEGVPDADATALEVMGDYPAYTGFRLKSRTFSLWMRDKSGSFAGQREQIARWFAPELGQRTLIATDGNSTSRQLSCQVLKIEPHPEHPLTYIVVMEAHDPVWQRTSTCSASMTLTSTGSTLTVSPSGNIYSKPILTIKPNSLKTSASADRYQKRFTVTNNLAWKLRSYPLEVTNGGWDTTGLVASNLMNSAGNDVRVVWRGASTDRWIDAPNTSATKVWIVADLEASEATVEGFITYGASGVAAPTVDASKEPIFDHANSLNSSWVYTVFGTDGGTRPLSWKKGLTPNQAFTPGYDWAWVWATSASDGSWSASDPWSELGVRKFLNVQSRWDLGVGWRLDMPVGISAVRLQGKRRLIDGTTRSALSLRYSATSLLGNRVDLWNDNTSTSAAWTAFGPSTFNLSPCGRLVTIQVSTPFLNANVETPDDYGFYMDTASLTLTAYPTVATSAEGAVYSLTASVWNVTASQNFALNLLVNTGETIEVDTAKRTVKNLTSGSYLNHSITLDALRRDWLPLSPSTSNTIRYDENGVVNNSFTITWNDRWI